MRGEHGRAVMRRLAVTLALLAAVVGAPIARVADAGAARLSQQAHQPATEGGGEPGDDIQRWWRVAGAVLCGFEIRLIIRAPAIGLNPYALAAGVAGCSLAALDVLTTK